MVKIISINNMGNQQVTSNNWAWLAGIWEGEGSFSIIRAYRRNKKTQEEIPSYTGRLTLSNTSDGMIKEIERVVGSLGVKCSIWRETASRKPTHKLAVHITINRQKDVLKICKKMFPYLVSKKDRAGLVMEFVASRSHYKRKVNRDPKTGRLLGIITQGLSENEESLFQKIRVLNQIGILDGTSETTRQGPYKRS